MRYFELILYKTWADLKSETGRYYISYLYWIVSPLIEMVIYYVVFGVLFHRKTDNFIPFLLIGILSWRWFSGGILSSSKSIISGKSLIQQIYLPKVLFPLIAVAENTFKFFIAFIIYLLLIILFGLPVTSAYFMLPLVLVVQLLLITGLGVLFASFTPFFPDFDIFLSYGIRMLFFLSGVFYDAATRFPEKLRFMYSMNPIARVISDLRAILVYGNYPDFQGLIYVFMLSVITFIIGCAVIQKYDRKYFKMVTQ